MAKACRIVPFDFVLERERELPPAEQTLWHLRMLHTDELLAYEDSVTAGHYGDALLKVLHFGLLGWDRLEGAECAAKGEGFARRLTRETLDAIQPYAGELSKAILERTRLQEGEAKNSSSP